MMVLGARIAEIEALYSCVLETADPRVERRLLAELAEAGTRLAADAGTAARKGPRAVPAPRRGTRRPGRAGGRAKSRPRLRRRIVRTQRTADWIIARTARRED